MWLLDSTNTNPDHLPLPWVLSNDAAPFKYIWLIVNIIVVQRLIRINGIAFVQITPLLIWETNTFLCTVDTIMQCTLQRPVLGDRKLADSG